MRYTKFNFVACMLLLLGSAVAFAQPDGGFGGGFPPMGGGMGPTEQQNSQASSISEGIDIGTMSLISDKEGAKLVEQLKKKIEKHNKALLKKFDFNNDGKLDKKELKAWKAWLKKEGGQPTTDDLMSGNMPLQGNKTNFQSQGGQNSSMRDFANTPPGSSGMPNGMRQNTPSITALAINIINDTERISAKTLTSERSNESVIRVKHGHLITEDLILKKNGGDTSSGMESDLFGLNAAFAVDSGASAEMSGGSIYTNAEGANAMFAYGKNAGIHIDNMYIETVKNSSRGLNATFGGAIIAKNVTISTKGLHSAALTVDKGEITVSNCNATTTGGDSPGIYSAGAIAASNSIFYASNSEAAVIEGKDSIQLNDCTLTGLKKCGVMFYQRPWGNSNEGIAMFTMKNSKLKIGEGPMFDCMNTRANLILENNDLIGHTGNLLEVSGSQRGGSQGVGAQIILETKNQILEGAVVVDSISSADLKFKTGTSFTGTINANNLSKQVDLTLAEGSKWVMTGDSYVRNLTLIDQTVEDAMKTIQTNGHELHYMKAITGKK